MCEVWDIQTMEWMYYLLSNKNKLWIHPAHDNMDEAAKNTTKWKKTGRTQRMVPFIEILKKAKE